MASPPLPPSPPLAGPISPAPEPRSLKDPPGPRGLSWPHPSPLSPPSHKGDLTGSAFGSSISGTVPTSPQSFPVVTTGPLEALAMSPGLGSSRCPPQTTLPAVLRPLLARPHARTAPHLNQASHSLEAGPGPRGPPQVLAQGVHELTQLLGAHGHLLPDQLQVLWGHGSERPATPALPARDPASPDLPSEKTGQFGQNRTQNPSSLTRGLILTPKVAKKNEDRMAKSRRQPRPSRTPHEGVHRGALRPPGAARMALWSETPQNQGPARFASGRVSVWGHCPDHFPPGPNCC